MPKMSVKMVGTMAHILDSERNQIAPWEPEKMQGLQTCPSSPFS